VETQAGVADEANPGEHRRDRAVKGVGMLDDASEREVQGATVVQVSRGPFT
jgi:hypothetical protein